MLRDRLSFFSSSSTIIFGATRMCFVTVIFVFFYMQLISLGCVCLFVCLFIYLFLPVLFPLFIYLFIYLLFSCCCCCCCS